jgi:DNA-binding FadR family transcriptional regulator
MNEEQGALTQLRAWLAQRDLPANSRLPAERELCEMLGVSRGELRKALAVLEEHGELWRHVGKGTFIGSRPPEELFDIAAIARATTPREVMRARLVIEPLMAREAALNATGGDLAELELCLKGARVAETWRHYETWDNRLHRAVAAGARNTVLTALFDTLNAVRRAVVWGRLRENAQRPPADHHSFAEHDRIVKAIAERDLEGAEDAMRRHLLSVQRHLISLREAAE